MGWPLQDPFLSCQRNPKCALPPANEAAISLVGTCIRNGRNCHLGPFALRQDRQGASTVQTWFPSGGLYGRWSRCCLTGQAHPICWYHRKCLSIRGTACSSSTASCHKLFCSATLHPSLWGWYPLSQIRPLTPWEESKEVLPCHPGLPGPVSLRI